MTQSAGDQSCSPFYVSFSATIHTVRYFTASVSQVPSQRNHIRCMSLARDVMVTVTALVIAQPQVMDWPRINLFSPPPHLSSVSHGILPVPDCVVCICWCRQGCSVQCGMNRWPESIPGQQISSRDSGCKPWCVQILRVACLKSGRHVGGRGFGKV